MKILLLCSNDPSSRIMYHALAEEKNIEITHIILEDKIPASQLLKRRIKTLGPITVIGQIAFMLFSKLLTKTSTTRIKTLLQQYQLNTTAFPESITIKVKNVNAPEVIALLKKTQVDAVVVNGTRIIKKEVLECIDTTFINTHMGITPKYRGVHGGYWAIANNDHAHCGVTIHLVDTGIDTGGVLYQDTITTNAEDNFTTYPTHQIAIAIPLMKAALRDVDNNNITPHKGISPSSLWSHPTLYTYAKNRLLAGIK